MGHLDADTQLPLGLREHVPTLQRLGVGRILDHYRAYRAEGNPRDADRFLLWLKRQGALSKGDLVELHTVSKVQVGGERRSGKPVGAMVEQRYRILTELGRGGMGVVQLARDSHLGRAVALKVLHDRAPAWVANRFVDEAAITAQLAHPNIVPIYALEHTRAGTPALAMKVVRGDTLEDIIYGVKARLKAGQPLEAGTALAARLQVFVKVCEALAYAHDRGVLHRDLKPENLMVGSHGEVYVMDWGIAKVYGDADAPADEELPAEKFGTGQITRPTPGETQAGTVVGTPSYMSPEQASGEPLGPASDQYALGLVLYELVCLQRANEGTTVEETLIRAIAGDRRPVKHALGHRIDKDLAAIIAKATRHDPAQRYPSVQALADDIGRYLRREETVARPDNPPRRARRWLGAHIGLLVTLLLLALGTVGATLAVGITAVALVLANASAQEAWVTRTVGAVAAKAHRVDARFLRHQGALDQIAAVTEQLWIHGQPLPGPIVRRADFEVGVYPPDFREQPFYGRPVSLDEPLTLLPPEEDFSAIEQDIRRLQPLRGTLRDAALASTDQRLLDATEAEQDRVLGVEGASAVWAYVGLENGVLINYPGLPDLGADYDPRKRPWYRASLGRRTSAWGEAYQDASGFSILLPCNRGIFDGDGRPLGVVGLDMSLGGVADLLEMDGGERAYLVDDEGRVVVSTTQRGLNFGATTLNNEALARAPLQLPTVRQAIVDGQTSGLVTEDGRTVVWNRLTAVDWTYVVVLEPRDWGW